MAFGRCEQPWVKPMPRDRNGTDQQFLLLGAAEIRDGLRDTKPGWVMGSFARAGELRYSQEFEVKEWDLRSMRKDWRNGEECGTEYIAVLEGVLTVVLGRLSSEGGIEEDRNIEVKAEQRILLASGVWRKLRASENIKALTVRHCAG